MTKEINRFVRFIAILSFVMATVVFLVAAGVKGFAKREVIDLIVNGFLIVIVANVPQGLPGTVITQLTIIAKRMAKRKVFVKQMELIETIGSATIIASDKTGTLTKNEMTVTDIW